LNRDGFFLDADPTNSFASDVSADAGYGVFCLTQTSNAGYFFLEASNTTPNMGIFHAAGTFASPAVAAASTAIFTFNAHSWGGSGSYTSDQVLLGQLSWTVVNGISTNFGTRLDLLVTLNANANYNSLRLDSLGQVVINPTSSISTGANLIWGLDASGNIGTVSNNRPGSIYAQDLIQVGNTGAGVMLGGGTGGSIGTVENNGVGFSFDSSGQIITSTRAINMQTYNVYWTDGFGNIGRSGGGSNGYARPFSIAAYNSFQLAGNSPNAPNDYQPTWQVIALQSNGVPLTTTNATVTTIYTYAMGFENNTVIAFKAKVVARRTDSADRAYFETTAVAYREAGGNLVIQSQTIDYESVTATSSAWTVSWTSSTTYLMLQVTGAASETIDWNGTLEAYLVQ